MPDGGEPSSGPSPTGYPCPHLAQGVCPSYPVRSTKVAEREGSAALTVAQLADAYRRDILEHRERGAEVWNVLRVHLIEATPVHGRPPFGQWDARAVKPLDVSNLVRLAVEERKVRRDDGRERVIGGPSTALHLLAEVKGMFKAAVGSGALTASPAALIDARALGLRQVSRDRKLEAGEVSKLFEVLDLNGMLAGTAKPQRLRETTRLALAFLLYVPCRSHSLIGARWDEVDFEARTWTIPVARLRKTRSNVRGELEIRKDTLGCRHLPATM